MATNATPVTSFSRRDFRNREAVIPRARHPRVRMLQSARLQES